MSDQATTAQESQLQPQPQQQQPNATPIQPQQSLISFNTTAPEKVADPIPPAYQSIIDQQNAQIAALMQQNQALNGQITQMVQGGAQFAQPVMRPQPQQAFAPQQQVNAYPPVYDGIQTNMFNPAALADDKDYSLEGLAEQIGRKS